MTNEALVSYSRLTLDNHFQGPVSDHAGRRRRHASTASSRRPRARPISAVTDVVSWSGQVGNLWAAANDVYAHNDALQFSDKLTKLVGAHGMKFGLSLERGQKQQNFQNLEAGQLGIRRRHAGRHAATPPPICSPAG